MQVSQTLSEEIKQAAEPILGLRVVSIQIKERETGTEKNESISFQSLDSIFTQKENQFFAISSMGDTIGPLSYIERLLYRRSYNHLLKNICWILLALNLGGRNMQVVLVLAAPALL